MKQFVYAATLMVLVNCMSNSAMGAIVDVLRYKLGETGSFVGQLPQDSVGTRHQTTSINTVTPGGVLDTGVYNSTNATRYAPVVTTITGSYGADSTGLPTDNFAAELWVRSVDINQPVNDVLVLNGNTNGSVSFRAGNGVWAGHIFNTAWVGAAAGVGQTATANEWTNLAIIRSNGTSTFYIDGVAQAGTTNLAPTVGVATAGIHVGVTPGGGSWFRGDLDEVRVFTFDPNVDDPVAALSVNFSAPEPSTFGLVALGVLAISIVSRRRPHRVK